MRPHAGAIAAIAMTFLFTSAKAHAQSASDFRLGTWGGSLDLGYGADRQELRSSDGTPGITSSRRRTLERLNVRNQGFYFVDPGFASGNLALNLGLLQERALSDGTATSREATLTGYAFDSTFLGALPYNGTVFANRSQNFLTQPFGRSDLTLDNHGVALRLREDSPLRDWGLPFFSAGLRLEQQRTKEDSTSLLGQSFHREELRNTLALDSHKGFETSDLEAHYEFNDLTNSDVPSASFQSQTATVSYSRDFGALLNRRSDTRLFYYTRSGTSRFSLFSADERLRIEHQQNLSTAYSYALTRTETDQGFSTTQRGVFDLRHNPYRDLIETVQAFARHQELNSGTRDNRGGLLGLQYQHALAGSGTAFGRASAGYQVDDNRLAASQINVIDESHAAPSPLGAGAGFLLGQPFVIVSSIVVVDTRGGARLPTTPGVDYDILAEGNFTRINPLPTSAVIQPGDPLAVSYTFELNPAIKYSTTSGAVSGGTDLRWIAFSAGHEQSDQKLISGQDRGFLQDTRRDSAQVDLRGAWQAVRAQAGAAYVRYNSTRISYNQQRYTQIVSYRPMRTLALGANADETLTRYTQPEHETDLLSIRFTADWFALSGWSTTAFAGRRIFRDSLQPTETINEASIRTRASYGKLDLSGAFTVNQRLRGGSELNSWRVDLLASRRF